MLVGAACVVWVPVSALYSSSKLDEARSPHERRGWAATAFASGCCSWIQEVWVLHRKGKSMSPSCDVEALHPRRTETGV